MMSFPLKIQLFSTTLLIFVVVVSGYGYKQREPYENLNDPECKLKPGEKYRTYEAFRKCKPVCVDLVCNVPQDYEDCCLKTMQNVNQTFSKAIRSCYDDFHVEIRECCPRHNETNSENSMESKSKESEESSKSKKEMCPHYQNMENTCESVGGTLEKCLRRHKKWYNLCRSNGEDLREKREIDIGIDIEDMPFF